MTHGHKQTDKQTTQDNIYQPYLRKAQEISSEVRAY